MPNRLPIWGQRTTFDNTVISDPVELDRPRGITIELTNPSDWVAADLLIELTNTPEDSASWAILSKPDKSPVRVQIDTAVRRVYVVERDAGWGVGAYSALRLRSVSVGGTSNVTQTNECVLVISPLD